MARYYSPFSFTVIGRGLGAASAFCALALVVAVTVAVAVAVAGVSARGSRDGLADMGAEVNGDLPVAPIRGAVVSTGARAGAGVSVC